MVDMELAGRRLGEFVLHERIGVGGYAAVYRCEQPALKRNAVIKVLHSTQLYDEAAQKRFLREAQLASRLDHLYAAHVYSFGVEEDGLLWIAMELVQGVTLGEWLRTRGPMPLDEFVPFFECVAQVVQAAHERGIVHRDLKPSNMMVLESGGRLYPKLLDFGIAKLHEVPDGHLDEDNAHDGVGDDTIETRSLRVRRRPRRVERTRSADGRRPTTRLTRPGIVMGSAPYMSPEQWGLPYTVGPATDIYSLGCVAYEALTGHAPFAATNTGEYFEQHIRATPPSLGEAFPASLDAVLRRALDKIPDARHRSARELAAELSAVLRAEPRVQLRSAAQQWHDRARPPGLLWGSDVLADVERWATAGSATRLSELECSFVAASQRRARRITWIHRIAIAGVAIIALAALQYRSAMQARIAERQARLAEQRERSQREIAEARITESALEQGRAALLHGEPEAQAYLIEAFKRNPVYTIAFMLARAMQPRLAEQAVFKSTHGRMWWAAFSPDARQIVTTDDRVAQLWNAYTYKLLATLPHGCEVYQAVYSTDGTRIVTAGEKMVRIWDAADGAFIRELRAASGRTSTDYYRVAISPDARFVAAINAAGSVVHVWNAVTGTFITELHNGNADFPRLVFSANGWLATTGGNEAHVFATGTWRNVLTIPGRIHSLAFDARGRLVTGAATGEVVLRDVPSGSRILQLRLFGEAVDSVAVSPDGAMIAAGSRDGTIQVWHARTGTLLSQLNPRHSKIMSVEFDPASQRLLAANGDGTVVIADPSQGLPIALLEGPRNVVRVASFDANSRVVGASVDGTARLWDATPPYRRWSSGPVSDDCGAIMFPEPTARFVAVGCRTHPTRIWDTANQQLLAELPRLTTIADGAFASPFPAVSPQGDLAAIARGTVVELYELPGGRLLRAIEHHAPVNVVAFAAQGRTLVTGDVNGSVRITPVDGKPRRLSVSAGVDAVQLFPDGRVVVIDADRRLRIYSATDTLLGELEMPGRILSLRCNGMRCVALTSYYVAAEPPVVIDIEQARVIAKLEGHVGHANSARWVPGERIITAGADGTARMWDGATGRLLHVYPGSSRYLADATLFSNGIVVAGDANGLLRFWDENTGARLWTLAAHRSAVVGIHMDGEDIVTRGFGGELSRWHLPSPTHVIDACRDHVHCDIVP